jgi:YHS domain-containing protein
MTSTFRTLLLCTLFGLSTAAFAKDAAKSEKPAKGGEAKKDDKAAKPINKICPVEGGEVDPEVTVTHKGQVVAFCCAGCDTEFKKDPAKYLAIIAKDPKNKAEGEDKGDAKGEGDAKHDKDDHDHGDAEKGEGKAEEKEAKLNAKCPVSGDDADPKMTVDYKGKTVAFCCEDCAKDFEKSPKKYLASLEAQEKAAKAEAEHDHDGDGKADHDEKDHKDDEHEHEGDEKAEKKAEN